MGFFRSLNIDVKVCRLCLDKARCEGFKDGTDKAIVALKELLLAKLPEANDESGFTTLEEDSPELNQMIGYNSCLTDIRKIIEELK